MGQTAEMMNKSTVKIAGLFGLLAFFTVLMVGILNRIGLGVILKRIFFAELIFIPIGLAAGYVYRTMLQPLLKNSEEEEASSGDLGNPSSI